MYLVGVDRSWLHTPFLRHRFKISHQSELDALQRSRIVEVTIDTELGMDVVDSHDLASPPVSDSANTRGLQGIEATDDPAGTENHTVVRLAENLAIARQRRVEWMSRVNQLFEGTRVTGIVSYREVTQLVDDMIGVIAERQAACYAVNSLRDSDPTLYEHGLTVCTFSIIMGQAQHYPHQSLQQLGVAALLHDIGLTRLPRNILKRAKAVMPAQQALYDSHPHQGIATLEKSGVQDPIILAVVRGHHDLAGATGLSNELMQEHTRLVGIVDQYDELITGHTGLPPMSSNQAMTQLYQRYRDQRDLLDGVSYLIRTIGVYPLYSLVALSTGELGVVGSITPGKAHLPVLYLCRDARGQSCAPVMELDLAGETEGGRTIHDIRDPRVEGIDVECILRQVAA
jgi:HD-GYP domain-containing protein (c-di-GMP phosphodiesterase class II)